MQKSETHEVFDIPMSQIYSDDTFNCRGSITPLDVKELSDSIKKIGLQQPIVVQPYNPESGYAYRLIAGHRRHAAYKLCGYETIPAMIRSGLSEVDARIFNLAENIQRQELNILQEAKAIQHLQVAGMTMKEVANRLKKSTGWVQVRYTLLSLPEPIQIDAAAGMITQSDIKDLFSLGSVDEMFNAVKAIKDSKASGGSLTVKKIKEKKHNKEQKKMDRRVRSTKEMFDMQDLLRKIFGNGLGTRILGWASGQINDYELMETIKQDVDIMGLNWHIPLEVVEAHNASLAGDLAK